MAVVTSGIEIEVVQGDLAHMSAAGLVVPTNAYGLMSDGVAVRIKAIAGGAPEQEATQSAPIAVGAAVVTDAGALRDVSKLIHVPVVDAAGMRVGIENVRRATRASLLAAAHFQLESIAIPGIGYGENGIPYDETARAILDEVRAFKGDNPKKVLLVDLDPTMIEAFQQMIDDK